MNTWMPANSQIIEERPTLAIVGAGRVGFTLGQTLHWRGYTVTAVYSRTADSAQRLADKLGTRAVGSPAEAAALAQLTFLTVPDDSIAAVCDALAAQAGDLSGRAIVHTSGVSSIAALSAAQAKGAWTGGLHPMLPIMDTERSPQVAFSVPWVAKAPDVTFGVEADSEPLHAWLAGIVRALNGVALWLNSGLHPGQDRALYHAAATIASNYLVTLFDEALRLLESLGADERTTRQALVHLAENTLRNIQAAGTVKALTGPIVRGDAGTIQKHIEALETVDPELAELYRLLGKRTTRLAAERGLSADQLAKIRQILEAPNENEHS